MAGNDIYIPKYGLISQDIAIDLRKTGAYIPAHWHRALEITYLLEGKADFIIEGERHTAIAGEAVIVDAGRIHEYFCPHDYEQLVIHIDDSYLASFMNNRRDFQILCDRTQPDESRIGPYLEICSSLAGFVRCYKDRPCGYRAQCVSLILHILYLLLAHFCLPLTRKDFPEPSRDQKRLREIVSYIDEKYASPISLDEIAGHFDLSSEYFSRFFTQKIGIPFKKHLNQVRLAHIYHDLCASDAPIMEIVERHGFTNYKLFSRMFREIYGMTPRALRQRMAAHQGHPGELFRPEQ